MQVVAAAAVVVVVVVEVVIFSFVCTSTQKDKTHGDLTLQLSFAQLFTSRNGSLPEGGCNSHCGCTTLKYQPLCGENNVQYFSPCHAGCTTVNYHNGDMVSYLPVCLLLCSYGFSDLLIDSLGLSAKLFGQ